MATILVVDDYPANREFLVMLLGYQGHHMLEAGDGADALARTRAEHPDLVISDILMPTMDGYEFVRQLRADPAIAATPVVFYTAHYHQREAEQLARNCGVMHILTKPCESALILQTVQQVLGAPPYSVAAGPPPDFRDRHLRVMTDKLSATADQLTITNQRLAALIEICLQLASERDPKRMLENVCRAARDLICSKYAAIGVTGKENTDVAYFTTSGIEAGVATTLSMPRLDAGIFSDVLTERRARRVVRASGDPPLAGLPRDYPAADSALIAPIVSLSNAYGWICLTDKLGAEAFDQEDEELLAILSAQAGRIYENGSLYARLQAHAARLAAEVDERKRAQETLAESEARFRTLTEMSSDFYWESDAEHRLVARASANRKLSMVSAFQRGTQIGERRWDIPYLSPGEAGWRAHRAALDAHLPFRDFELSRRGADGTERHISISGDPVFDASGAFKGYRGVGTDITERKRAALELRESERRFSDLLGNVELVSLMLDREARITYANGYLLRLTGWKYEEVVGRNWAELFIPPELADWRVNAFEALVANRPEARHRESEIRTRSGGRRLIRWNNSVLRSEVGEVIGTASIGEDITERVQAEARIIYLNRVYAVLSGINTLIVRVRDRDELFREACRMAVEAGGFRMALIAIAERSSGNIVPVASAGKDDELLCAISGVLSSGESASNTMVAQAMREQSAVVANASQSDPRVLFGRKYAESGVQSMAVLPLLVAEKAVGVIALYASEREFFHAEEMKLLTELAGDVAFAIDHIEKQERLDYLAYYDALTGLANRKLFLERVAQYMRSAAGGGRKLALFLLDLERFKNINDSLGQPAGDALLRQVAEWLARNTGDANLVARLEADHFAVVLPEFKRDGAVARLVEKSLAAFLNHPFRLNDAVFRVAAKVGVALFPEHGADADTLFKNAEAALKKAKLRSDPYLFYVQGMSETVAEKLTLENRLRQALDQREFVLHYQPKVSLAEGKLTGAEALIRWNDPRTGLVAPGRFIPVLEETGLIHEVGRQALRQAIDDCLRWRSAGLAAVRIAVNVSPLQLRHRNFIAEIRQAIDIDAQAAAGLELEITESLIMEDIKHSIASLQAIRDMGVSIAIDDFGTGFSSLSYLAKLPVDSLKIDRSFVTGMTLGPDGLALVSTIINLGHSLKLKVVAEGVETEEQSRLLRLLSCDEMQGYLVSKPVAGEIFEAKYLAAPARG